MNDRLVLNEKGIWVFADRDGTINKDENYYLGSSPNWKNQIEFLEGVIEGIGMINSIPNSKFFILTNQSGVALQGGDFDNLTYERMQEVNQYIIGELEKKGLKIDGYFTCPFVNSQYAIKKMAKGMKVDSNYIKDNNPYMKPNIGMIDEAFAQRGIKNKEGHKIYMIGDRATDVEMGLRAGGTGILISSFKTRELEDERKVARMQGRTYITNNFLNAAKYIKAKSN